MSLNFFSINNFMSRNLIPVYQLDLPIKWEIVVNLSRWAARLFFLPRQKWIKAFRSNRICTFHALVNSIIWHLAFLGWKPYNLTKAIYIYIICIYAGQPSKVARNVNMENLRGGYLFPEVARGSPEFYAC